MRSIWAPLLRCAIAPNTPPEEARVMRILVPITAGLLPCFILWFVDAARTMRLHSRDRDDPDDTGPTSMSSFGVVIGLVALLFVLGAVFSTHRLRAPVIETYIAASCLVIVLCDWGQGAYGGSESWQIGIVIMDMCVVFRARRVVTLGCLGVLTAWVITRSLEDLYRFGVYEIPFTTLLANDALASRRDSVYVSIIVMFVTRIVPLHLDFRVTEDFCNNMREAHDRIQASIEVSQDIAVALADFDLPQAHQRIDDAEHLPPVMREAYSRLLNSLEQFRSYLPGACLVLSDEESQLPRMDASQSVLSLPSRPRSAATSKLWITRANTGSDSVFNDTPPPSGDGATILFTDIEGSTELWDHFPVGMQRALSTHNAVIRGCVTRSGGYEVKTVGDAFMVAFGDVCAAVRCALSMQVALVEVVWPGELLAVVRCAKAVSPDGTVAWNGIRIRAGLHCGVSRREMNPITGRADYFGSVVNVAARTESAALVGGVVCVTDAVLVALGGGGLSEVGDPVVAELGTVDMKGVSHPPTLHALFPRELAARAAEWSRAWKQRRAGGSQEVPSVHSGGSRSSPSSRSSIGCANALSRSRLGVCRATAASAKGLLPTALRAGTILNPIMTIVTAVDSAVDRSGGTIVAFSGMTALATWNAGGRPCRQHAGQAVRACGHIARSVPAAEVCVRVGAASGNVMHGGVGSKHRYLVSLGETSEVAQRLACAACSLGAFALVAGVDGEPCVAQDPSGKRFTRAVDCWPRADGGTPIVVYELDIHSLRAADGVWGFMTGALGESEGIWGSDEWSATLAEAHGLPRSVVAAGAGNDGRRTELQMLDSDEIEARRTAAQARLRQMVTAGPNDPLTTPISEAATHEADCVLQEQVLVRVVTHAEAGITLTPCPIVWEFPLSSLRERATSPIPDQPERSLSPDPGLGRLSTSTDRVSSYSPRSQPQSRPEAAIFLDAEL